MRIHRFANDNATFFDRNTMINASALQNSPLNKFLYSEVGTEPNGCGLTILSVLARLGKDPWTESALWAQQPQKTAIEALTQSIVRMPLTQAELDRAGSTASRLVGLLPAYATTAVSPAPSSARLPVPLSLILVTLYFLVYFAVLKL
jgi:hypothetical protein